LVEFAQLEELKIIPQTIESVDAMTDGYKKTWTLIADDNNEIFDAASWLINALSNIDIDEMTDKLKLIRTAHENIDSNINKIGALSR